MPKAATKSEKLFQNALDLVEGGKTQDASKVLKKLLKNDPKHLGATLLYGDILLNTKRFEMALKQYVAALKIDPNNALVWRNLGYIQLYGLNDMDAAITSFSRALGLNPQDGKTYYYLGYISQNMNQFDDAISLYENGLQFTPSHAEMMSYLGMCHLRQRHFEEAKKYVLQALALAPENANVFVNAIRMEEFLELSDEQRKQLDKAIEGQRNNPQFGEYAGLYLARHARDEGRFDDAVRALEKIDDNADKQGVPKYFMLGDIARRQGDHEKAFGYYSRANAMQASSRDAKRYKSETIYKAIENVEGLLTPDFIEKVEENIKKFKIGRPYRDPVFLMGFARSGTTLAGRILDSHPDLITTDEYGALEQIRIHAGQKFAKVFPQALDSINLEELKFMQALYNEKQGGLPLAHKDKLFIDKMPFNTLHMLLIHAIFPHAKFLYIQRHPLDTVLSCFMQYFSINTAMIHMYDLEHIANLYVATHKLWQKQRDMLPIDYHEFKYENMIADFDGEIGAILDFLGVGWDDSVRDFYKRSQKDAPTTLTPSRTQVNQKLYKESQNRWKHYEQHLGKAIDILAPIIEESGYSL